jgi:hypothetical protein
MLGLLGCKQLPLPLQSGTVALLQALPLLRVNWGWGLLGLQHGHGRHG